MSDWGAGTFTVADGYEAVVVQDEVAENPIDAWTEPPLVSWDGRHLSRHGEGADTITLMGMVDRVPAGKLRRMEFRHELRTVLGVPAEDLFRSWAIVGKGRRGESWRDAFRECVARGWHGLPEGSDGWFKALGFMASASGLAFHSSESWGCCQGDWARVFVLITREWAEVVGAPRDSWERQAKGTFDLHSHWLWGDVYGAVRILDPKGAEVDDSSCWGFYGPDHEENGLMDWCRAEVRAHVEWLAEERKEAEAMACRGIMTVA
jgi:hypothetical protein